MANKNRILIFTGNGKGKTTAALGMALRGSGHGQKVLVIQFIKNTQTGEHYALEAFDSIEIVQTGLGFVREADSDRFDQHKEAAQKGLQLAQQAINSQNYQMLILDEICGAIAEKLLTEEQVLELIRNAPADICLVLTGRKASASLIDLADTVTEMLPVKHAFDCGKTAQNGVEN